MMYRTPEEHDANPPASWTVAKAGPRLWHLNDASGETIWSFPTKRDAEQARTEGFLADLYEKEGRWFRGEPVTGWKQYVAVAAG